MKHSSHLPGIFVWRRRPFACKRGISDVTPISSSGFSRGGVELTPVAHPGTARQRYCVLYSPHIRNKHHQRAEPILATSYLSSFIRLMWLSADTCPVFVAVTEREIRVHTHRWTVLINANFQPRVQHSRQYCTTITSSSVPFHSGFYTFPNWKALLATPTGSSGGLCSTSLTSFCWFTSAPFFKSWATISWWPCQLARYRALWPVCGYKGCRMNCW